MEIHCDGVTHAYTQGVAALKNVTLELSTGITGLVGVNGAGKSTLLRIMSGGLRPTAGDVTLLGGSLYGRGRRAVLASTALMPQEFDVPQDMRALDVVRYLGWLRGLSSREVRSRAPATLEAVGLSERSAARVSTLSGGMLRRLALAQALIGKPRLLLLDEPTTGLDPEQRAAVRQLIADLPNSGATIVSSHVMEDIESLAQNVIVLDGGEAVYQGGVSQFVNSQEGAGSAEEAFLALLLKRRAR